MLAKTPKGAAKKNGWAPSSSHKKRTPSRTIGHYHTYNFKNHDPVLDQLDRLFELAGKDGLPVKRKYLAEKSGVREGTLRNWFNRKVKRPNGQTMSAVIHACGASRPILYRGKLIHATGLIK